MLAIGTRLDAPAISSSTESATLRRWHLASVAASRSERKAAPEEPARYIPGIAADPAPNEALTSTLDLALAHAMADAADAITLRRFRAADLAVDTKADLTPVTEADRAVEEMILRPPGVRAS